MDESKKSLLINNLERFSCLDNFRFEDSGIRLWKAYSNGQGKLFPYDTVYVQHQGSTMFVTEDSFSNTIRERALKLRKNPSGKTSDLTTDVNPLFEYSVPGCTEAFDSFSDLELHLDVVQHNNKQLPIDSVYDRIKRDYAAKFASVDVTQETSPVTLPYSAETPNRQPLEMGWVISKTHAASTRFSKKVKEYQPGKFVIRERTGRKADPAEVEKDMTENCKKSIK